MIYPPKRWVRAYLTIPGGDACLSQIDTFTKTVKNLLITPVTVNVVALNAFLHENPKYEMDRPPRQERSTGMAIPGSTKVNMPTSSAFFISPVKNVAIGNSIKAIALL